MSRSTGRDSMKDRGDLVKRLLEGLTLPTTPSRWRHLGFKLRKDRLDLRFREEDTAEGAPEVNVLIEEARDETPCYLRTGAFCVSYSCEEEAAEVGVAITEAVGAALRRNEGGVPTAVLFHDSRPRRQELDHLGEVRINIRCNETCVFCNSHGFMDNFAGSPAEVRDAIRAHREAGAEELCLTGMEPTLDPNLASYVRLGREVGFHLIHVQSNGLRLAEPEFCRELADAGVEIVTLSLHGADPAVAARITGVEDDLERTLRAAENLRALGVKVQFNLVVCRWNLDQPEPLVLLLARRFCVEEDSVFREAFQALLDARREGREIAAPEASEAPPGEDHGSERQPVSLSISFIAPSFDDLDRREMLIPRFSDALVSIRAALKTARAEAFPVSIPGRCGIPPCLLGEDRVHLAPVLYQVEMSVPMTHFKPATCRGCPLGTWCEGVWHRYAELHGIGEIIAARRDLGPVENKLS